MSACPQCGDRLIEQIYGELGADEIDLLEAHLDGSPACRRELESLRATLGAVGAPPVHGPSAALIDALRDEARRSSSSPLPSSSVSPAPRLVTDGPPRSPRTVFPIWATAVAAAIVAILAIGLFTTRSPESQLAEVHAPALDRDAPSLRADAAAEPVTTAEAALESSEGATAASDTVGELERESSSRLADVDAARPPARARPQQAQQLQAQQKQAQPQQDQPPWDAKQRPAAGRAQMAKSPGQAPSASATVPNMPPTVANIVAAIQDGELTVALSTYDAWSRESAPATNREEPSSSAGADDAATVARERAGKRSGWAAPATAGAKFEAEPARGAAEQRRVADSASAQRDPFAAILRALLASGSRPTDEEVKLDGATDRAEPRRRIELLQRLVDDAPPATAVEAARAAVELSARIGDPAIARRAQAYLDARSPAASPPIR